MYDKVHLKGEIFVIKRPKKPSGEDVIILKKWCDWNFRNTTELNMPDSAKLIRYFHFIVEENDFRLNVEGNEIRLHDFLVRLSINGKKLQDVLITEKYSEILIKDEIRYTPDTVSVHNSEAIRKIQSLDWAEDQVPKIGEYIESMRVSTSFLRQQCYSMEKKLDEFIKDMGNAFIRTRE